MDTIIITITIFTRAGHYTECLAVCYRTASEAGVIILDFTDEVTEFTWRKSCEKMCNGAMIWFRTYGLNYWLY